MLLTDRRPETDAAAAEPPSGSRASPLFKPSSGQERMAGAAAMPPAAAYDALHSQMLIVGQGIALAGEITACDRLVVEGRVEVVLNRTRAIEITESGVFTNGKADVEDADISGIYEGELTVRRRLLIRATGRVKGTVRYRELEVEQGGQLMGAFATLDGAG